VRRRKKLQTWHRGSAKPKCVRRNRKKISTGLASSNHEERERGKWTEQRRKREEAQREGRKRGLSRVVLYLFDGGICLRCTAARVRCPTRRGKKENGKGGDETLNGAIKKEKEGPVQSEKLRGKRTRERTDATSSRNQRKGKMGDAGEKDEKKERVIVGEVRKNKNRTKRRTKPHTTKKTHSEDSDAGRVKKKKKAWKVHV